MRQNVSMDINPLVIKGRGIAWTPDLLTVIRRQLERITARFRARIRRIAVSLEDVNGPRGGIDKRCRVEVALAPQGRIAASASASKSDAAIIKSVARIRNVLRRRIQTRRSRRNNRIPARDGRN